MNIGSILKRSIGELKHAGAVAADLDATVLLEHALEKDRSFIFTKSNLLITNSEYHKFRRLIRRRKSGEPIAYILGEKEFFGNRFFVNKNVLIPRPESELLVEQAIDFIHKQRDRQINILDVGTGSGCIIISLKLAIDQLFLDYDIRYFASDISKKALYVAKKNARYHIIDKDIKFFCSDLFSNKKMPKMLDIIVANLPYIPDTRYPIHDTKPLSGISFEPKDAIFANNNGTATIRRFLDEAKNKINADGSVLLEVDPRNAKAIFDYAKAIFDRAKITTKKDLAGLDRVILINNLLPNYK